MQFLLLVEIGEVSDKKKDCIFKSRALSGQWFLY